MGSETGGGEEVSSSCNKESVKQRGGKLIRVSVRRAECGAKCHALNYFTSRTSLRKIVDYGNILFYTAAVVIRSIILSEGGREREGERERKKGSVREETLETLLLKTPAGEDSP